MEQDVTFCRVKIPVDEDKKIRSVFRTWSWKIRAREVYESERWSLTSSPFMPVTAVVGCIT